MARVDLQVLTGGKTIRHPDPTTTNGALVILVALELLALWGIRRVFKSAQGG